MNLLFSAESIEQAAVETLVILTPQYDKVSGSVLKDLDEASAGAVQTILETGEFSGKEGQAATLFHPDSYGADRVILAGLGAADEITVDTIRRCLGRISRNKGITSVETAGVFLGAYDGREFAQAAIEGYLLGSWELTDYKSAKEDKAGSGLKALTLIVDRKAALRRVEAGAARGEIIAQGQLLARRLAATPANDLTPRIYAETAQKHAKKYGVSCRVLDEKAIAREKMGGLLSVARGSEEPPRFLILTYNGQGGDQKPIVLVGKGVTFDSGGISLKQALNMHEMKQDMAGSAAVLATIITAARLKINRNIVALIPTTENMPSGTATRPGDVVTMRNGKTVEIINTDAEGRLILADALDYANKFSPQAVIDVATLTGATLFILGYSGAPIVGNNPRLMDQLRLASESSSERVWELPLWDDFKDQIKSDIADIMNSGGRPAGTLTASAFLSNFIGDWPWAHVDIAYVDLEPKGTPYVPKGASGFGVRLLIDLLSNWKKV